MMTNFIGYRNNKGMIVNQRFCNIDFFTFMCENIALRQSVRLANKKPQK